MSVPRVPWHEVPVTPQEDEAFAAFDCTALTPQQMDERVHQALCVEEGCGRCAA
jgi:hypothetical protein